MQRDTFFSYRLLPAALALIFGLPAGAYGVGLGKLTVLSGLGQPLNAQIELVAAEKNELDSLAARVADPSAYRQANVEYQSILTQLKVNVDKGSNGEPLLRVTSAQAVNEPFVDLLLEVNWAAGRMVREYTFLLDPPEYSPKTAAKTLEPKAPAQAPVLPKATGSSTAPSAAPAVAVVAETAAVPAESVAKRAAPSSPAAATPSANEAKATDTYGPVKRGETLGKIATKVRPDGVTLDQMLIALYQANKGAFIGKNIHLLKTGETLSVPSKSTVSSIAETDAVKLVRVQTSDWRAYMERVANTAPAANEETQGAASSGKITTLAEDKSKPVEPGKDQLHLSKGGGTGLARVSSDESKAAAAEDASARAKALQEANSRVADLERQVKDLQKLVSIKNQMLSDLQQQAQKAKASEAAVAAAPAPAAPAVAAPAVVPPAAKIAEAPAPSAPAQVAPAAPAVVAAAAPAVAEAAKPVAPPPPPVVASKTETEAPPAPESKAQPKPAAGTPAPQESTWMDDATSNPWLLAGGAAVLALGGLWAVLAGRRKRAGRGFEDSVLTGTDIKTSTVFGSTGGGVVNTGENSLTTGFSRQGLGNIDTDEVDPIAEAEVYLAYGRDVQAEEILRDALQKDPNRHEIYLKLLEIEAHNGRADGFAKVAAELHAVTKGHGDIWAKAAGMGREMDPTNALYADSVAVVAEPPPPPSVPVAEMTPPPAIRPELDETQVFTIPPALTPEPIKPLAIDLEHFIEPSVDEPVTSPRLEPEVSGDTPSFETTEKFVALDWDPAPPTISPDIEHPANPSTIPDSEFWAKTPPSMNELLKTEAHPSPAFAMMDVHPVPVVKPKPIVTALDLDKLDLSFDPHRPPLEEPTPSVLDGQWHDAATKLDLAKAYQEMGDVEGAREILQEVLHEGDSEQKKEANGLLERLSTTS